MLISVMKFFYINNRNMDEISDNFKFKKATMKPEKDKIPEKKYIAKINYPNKRIHIVLC